MIQEFISGGQTGADRAALDAAIRYGVKHSGWCPKGRKAEDGPLGGQYRLMETPSSSYIQRTEWNVRDSDATVIFTLSRELTGGSKRTGEFAIKRGQPWIHIGKLGGGYLNPAVELQKFVEQHGITRLNVAGSRESKEPGIYRWVYDVIDDAFFWSIRHPGMLGGPGEG